VQPSHRLRGRTARALGHFAPPLRPAETWARTTVESTIRTRSAVPLMAASESQKASDVPEPFPKNPARDVVNHVMQGFKKLPIVAPLVAAPRPRCLKQLQNNRPLLFRHGGERYSKTDNPSVTEELICESHRPLLG
jgi:hypothetical protein